MTLEARLGAEEPSVPAYPFLGNISLKGFDVDLTSFDGTEGWDDLVEAEMDDGLELAGTSDYYGTVIDYEEAELAGMHLTVREGHIGFPLHPPRGDYYNPPEAHARHSGSILGSLQKAGHDINSL